MTQNNLNNNHPLLIGIDEIDISKSHRKSYTYLYSSNHDNIDEINMSSRQATQTTQIKKSEVKPPIPERPKYLQSANFSANEKNQQGSDQQIKLKVPKRIAPRILPKIPDKINQIQTVNNLGSVSPLSQEPAKMGTACVEQNYFIPIEEVAWYYKKDQIDSSGLKTQTSQPANEDSNYVELNSTSNSSESSNTANNKKWVAFNRIDSNKLEINYRAISNEMNVETKLVTVLDDIYEVNLSTKKCYAIYWKNKRTFSVMRSVWFQENGEPFEEKSSDEIEAKHIELFRDVLTKESELDYSINFEMDEIRGEASSSTEDMKTKTDGSKNMTEPLGIKNIEEGIVTWYSKNEVYWEKNKMSLIEKVNFGFSKFRNKINGMRIKRGIKNKVSKETEYANDKEGEVTHLVFVVHGIAQKMYENSIVKSCADLRKECDKKKKEYFPNNKNQRYMFLPVDWRSSLTLDDGIIETITPNSIQTIREKLNSSALDIMYYTSPLFRIEILNSLSSELNRLYNLFCEKNPYFKAKYNKVSFVAHSLGTVIVYDILTSENSCTQFSNAYSQITRHEREKFQRYSQNNNSLLDEYLKCKNRIEEIENNLVKSNSNVTPLGFPAENFFSLGSPLAVFLAMRGVRPAGTGTQEHILPTHLCKHLYNIFHPSDPIAYRIEPLIIKNYSNKNPIEIHKSDIAPKFTYKELNEKRTAIQINSRTTSSYGPTTKNKLKLDKELDEGVAFNPSGVSLHGYASSPNIEQVELENGLDFQMQDSNFELMATLRAHGCYWKSPDVALFIISQLCQNDA